MEIETWFLEMYKFFERVNTNYTKENTSNFDISKLI